MALISDQGFVIASTRWRESSLIVRFFTLKLGKIGLAIRGARRPKSRIGSYFDTFSHLKIVYYMRDDADLGKLKESSALDYFPSIRRDLVRFALCSLFFEILDRGLAPRDRQRDLYRLTTDFLEGMNGEKYSPGAAPPFFLALVARMGFAPEVGQCRSCKSSENLDSFDPARGSAVCSRCREKEQELIPLPETVRGEILRFDSTRGEWNELPPWPEKTLLPFFRIMRELVQYHYEAGLKSAGFLMQQLKEL